MAAPVTSTVSLVIQIVVLGLLVGGYLLKRQNMYRQHATVMLSAVVLHLTAILVVMVPSLGAFISVPSSINYADPLTIVTFVHVPAGLIAALLGIWLVSSWHFQTDFSTCFKKKRVMDVTIVLWSLSIVLGIVLYLAIIQAF